MALESDTGQHVTLLRNKKGETPICLSCVVTGRLKTNAGPGQGVLVYDTSSRIIYLLATCISKI